MVYRFIKDNYEMFGVRWLLRKFSLCPNAYYNFLKARRSGALHSKQIACNEIKSIYHETNGILGYRNMKIFLSRRGINLSKTTVHKYMNKELMMKSIVRRKKPGYVKGTPHKVFPNLIKQNFIAEKTNNLWCTDFTYLFLTNGSKRYNCSIIDLYDRSIVASIKIIQSMSKAGCPYDNAPMERYYNTLKNELIYLHHFHTDNELNQAVSDFAYSWYNHIRPHTFNNGLTPFEARYKN